ncbi:NADH-quinone oxidoreductase subunit C/D, partial [Bienertia sinuspersici]
MWRSDKFDLDSGVYLMIHMQKFYGQPFNSDLSKQQKKEEARRIEVEGMKRAINEKK